MTFEFSKSDNIEAHDRFSESPLTLQTIPKYPASRSRTRIPLHAPSEGLLATTGEISVRPNPPCCLTYPLQIQYLISQNSLRDSALSCLFDPCLITSRGKSGFLFVLHLCLIGFGNAQFGDFRN